jgi:hypothetical protein
MPPLQPTLRATTSAPRLWPLLHRLCRCLGTPPPPALRAAAGRRLLRMVLRSPRWTCARHTAGTPTRARSNARSSTMEVRRLPLASWLLAQVLLRRALRWRVHATAAPSTADARLTALRTHPHTCLPYAQAPLTAARPTTRCSRWLLPGAGCTAPRCACWRWRSTRHSTTGASSATWCVCVSGARRLGALLARAAQLGRQNVSPPLALPCSQTRPCCAPVPRMPPPPLRCSGHGPGGAQGAWGGPRVVHR